MSDTTYYVAAVTAVIFKGEKVLAMRRSLSKKAGPGLWETPSGRIDAGEHPFEAVKREISEECGLNVRIDPRPITAYQSKRIDKPMILIVYRAQYISGEVICSLEHDDHAWLTPDEFARYSRIKKLVNAVYHIAKLPNE